MNIDKFLFWANAAMVPFWVLVLFGDLVLRRWGHAAQDAGCLLMAAFWAYRFRDYPHSVR